MKHPETQIVTKENGPRPAGRSDECFYCHAAMGALHEADCVCRLRTVVLRYSYDVVVTVPEQWSSDTIEHHRNESGWCANNSVEELRHRSGTCWCGDDFSAEYLREATAEDEMKWHFDAFEADHDDVQNPEITAEKK